MERIIFADLWESFFAGYGLKSFDDFFGYSRGQTINTNSKRDVVMFTLGEGAKQKRFFMKRFHNPHFKDMLFTRGSFGGFCSQSRCEWENTNLLLSNGVDTYRPSCYGERTKWGIEKESFSITEELAGQCLTDFISANWPQLTQPQKEEIVAGMAKAIRRIHDAGISLPDLYVWHIFIKQSENSSRWEFAFIDLHRMSHNVTCRNKQIRNLGALDHSMVDKYFDESLRQLFFESYAGCDWPGDIDKMIAKAKRRSKAISRRRKPKPY